MASFDQMDIVTSKVCWNRKDCNKTSPASGFLELDSQLSSKDWGGE